MSMRFDRPISECEQEMIKALMGDKVAAIDEHQALLNTAELKQQEMKQIANELEQVVTVEINAPDEIKTMADGTQYRVTPQGWRKIAT